MMDAFSSLFHNTLDNLPLGIFLLDRKGCIREWNTWMVEKTMISARHALGKTIIELFPNFMHSRFTWALDMVFSCSAPQLLSQVLNRYVIPIPLKLANPYGFQMMQQKVQISPLMTNKGESLALVTLVDVTENAIQEAMLIEVAKRLQDSTYHDPLTNLYNRRFMEVWLEKELLAAQRYVYPIACLMIDLDHFKQVNDTLGHDEGDRVLCDFSKVLLKHSREADICVRYGGEEFALILSHCSLKDAYYRAKALTNDVRKAALGTRKEGEITCSTGISVYLPESPCSEADLLKQADNELYKAKHAGRDRVNCVGMETFKKTLV